MIFHASHLTQSQYLSHKEYPVQYYELYELLDISHTVCKMLVGTCRNLSTFSECFSARREIRLST